MKFTALALLLVLLLVTGARADTQRTSWPNPEVKRLAAERDQWKLSAQIEARMVRRFQHSLRAQVHLGGFGLEKAFLCIHQGEGAWNDATGNGFYGGLQMDLGFQRSYGSEFLSHWGPANLWPASVQIAVAMRAYFSRGFSPWPNTSRACGL